MGIHWGRESLNHLSKKMKLWWNFPMMGFYLNKGALKHTGQKNAPENFCIIDKRLKVLTACLTVRGKPSRMNPDSPFSSPLLSRLVNNSTIISSDTNLPWLTISVSCKTKKFNYELANQLYYYWTKCSFNILFFYYPWCLLVSFNRSRKFSRISNEIALQ